MRRDWDAAVLETRRIDDEVFQPASRELSKLVSNEAVKAKLGLNLRTRLERALTEQILDTQRKTASERKEARVALEDVNSQVVTVTREILQDVDTAIGKVRSELARMDLSDMQADAIVEKRHVLETELEDAAQKNLNAPSHD